MTVVMPVWKQTAQREKEEELVFRGKQYVHAIGLFQRKFANAYPPNIDVLVEQRFLRKKFKDPITNDDFVPIPVGQGAPGARAAAGRAAWRPAGSTARLAGQAQTTPAQQPAGGRRRATPSAPVRPVRPRAASGGDQQEQGSIDSPLQRTRSLQRVGLRLHSSRFRRPAPAERPARALRASAAADRPGQRPGRVNPGGQPARPTGPAAPADRSARTDPAAGRLRHVRRRRRDADPAAVRRRAAGF